MHINEVAYCSISNQKLCVTIQVTEDVVSDIDFSQGSHLL